jgi:aminomethyltransferase|tara:strand:+ start:1139 stop:2326 length:1188 start_codon:yes stop_codon:yes gene_type:complete
MDNSFSFTKPLLETPFHERTYEACYNNDWYRWAGYKIAREYSNTELEYTAMRNTAGVLDITPMHKYDIKGADAIKFVDKLVTRNVTEIKSGQVMYIIWCNEDGNVIDDGTVFCFDSNHLRIFCAERNLNWFSDTAIGFDVEVEDVSDTIAALAFQGPLSCKILNLLNVKNIENLRPFYFDDFDLNGCKVTISRTGFSGDLGYEIWCKNEDAISVWDSLFKFNRDYKVLPAGMNALEMVRVEAGFIQPNADFMSAEQALRPNRMRNPFELGMGWLVDLNKNYFTGKKNLVNLKKKTLTKKLVGLDIQGDKPAIGSVLYDKNKKEIGIVTAGMWSPSLKSNIAFGYVDKDHMKIGSKVFAEIYHPEELEYKKIWAECSVVKKQFFNPPRRHKVPAEI